LPLQWRWPLYQCHKFGRRFSHPGAAGRRSWVTTITTGILPAAVGLTGEPLSRWIATGDVWEMYQQIDRDAAPQFYAIRVTDARFARVRLTEVFYGRFLQSAEFLLENRAILRNKVRMVNAESPSVCDGLQSSETMCNSLRVNPESLVLPLHHEA